MIWKENGAEDLLGRGDMLVSITGSELKRVQGAWVSDEEIYRVVQYIKENANLNAIIKLIKI